MNKPAIALALITISVALTFTGSFAYLMVASQSVHESSASTATINSASPMATINQDKNSSLSPSAPSAPTPVQNHSQSSNGVEISAWSGVSSSNTSSLVVIDSPINNAKYSTQSLILTVHAASPSWSYMIDLFLQADWLENGQRLFYHMDYWPGQFFLATGITVTTTLVDIPEGNHTMIVTANEFTSIAGSSSVHFSISSAPTLTPASPAPTPLDDSSYPEGIGEWIPFGNVGMISPTNQTYNTNNLSINVIGVIIAVGNPYLSYSLDGGPRQPIAIGLKKPEGLEVTMQRQISGSVTLPPLTNGAHVIVLFADLGFDSRKAKETVYFEVEAG